MSLTPYSDLLLRISRDDSFIQVLRFLIMSTPNQAQVQKQVTTQAIASTSTNPNLDITPLIMPISYAISGAIALATITAFLGQMFKLGK